MHQNKKVIVQSNEPFKGYLLLYHRDHGIDIGITVFVEDMVAAQQYISPDTDQLLILGESNLIRCNQRQVQILRNLNQELICVLCTDQTVGRNTNHLPIDACVSGQTPWRLARLVSLFLDGTLSRELENRRWQTLGYPAKDVKQMVASG